MIISARSESSHRLADLRVGDADAERRRPWRGPCRRRPWPGPAPTGRRAPRSARRSAPAASRRAPSSGRGRSAARRSAASSRPRKKACQLGVDAGRVARRSARAAARRTRRSAPAGTTRNGRPCSAIARSWCDGTWPAPSNWPGRGRAADAPRGGTYSTRPSAFSTAWPRPAGLSATTMPADFIASILSSAPPLPPATMAPAWPMRRPGGAVRPAMKPAVGFIRPFFASSLRNCAASSSAEPPISPIMMIDFGLRVGEEPFQHVDVLGPLDRVAADADAGRSGRGRRRWSGRPPRR